MQLAGVDGLDFGSDALFTYGPLGFLKVPLALFQPYAALGGLYQLAVRLGLGISLVWAGRRTYPLVVAVPVALIAATLAQTEPVIALTLVWCAAALGPGSPSGVRTVLPVAGGVISAIELLGKVNVGVLILPMVLVTVLAMEGRRARNLLGFASSLLLAGAALWFAGGQGLGDLWPYMHGSFEIVSGYSTAMVVEGGGPIGLHIAGALAIAAGALLAAYLGTRELPGPRTAAAVAIVALAALAMWKQTFVRHGPTFVANMFPVVLAPWLAFPWREVRLPRVAPNRTVAVALAGFLVTAGLYFPLTDRSPFDVLKPVTRARAALDESGDLLLPGRVDRAREEALAAFRSYYRLDSRSLKLLEGRTVYVEPTEIPLVWAYDLEWRPVPVLQSYAAYTPYLDELGASELSSAQGPERIIRHATFLTPQPHASALDREYARWGSPAEFRFRPWEQPATTLAMFCRYRPLRTTSRYQVLARSQKRCGQSRLLGSRTVAYGEDFPVPRPPGPGYVLLAEVHGAAPSGWESLRTLLYRAAQRHATFDDRLSYRVVPQTLSEELIVSAPARLDFPRPFALAFNPRTIRFDQVPRIDGSTADLNVEFFALRVRPVEGRSRRPGAGRGR